MTATTSARPGFIGGGVPDQIATTLRVACDALASSPDQVSCIELVSHLPPHFVITEVMGLAEELAREHGFRARMYVHDGGLDVRFERGAEPR